MSALEAEAVRDVAREEGRMVAEAFMVLYHPQWQRARQLVRQGGIGDLRAIQTIFTYFLDNPANVRNQPGAGGGSLYDVGCYAANTARYLFEAEPLRVVAVADRDPIFGTDRLTSGMLEFPGGRHLSFTVSTQLVATQRISVLGSNGRLSMEVPFNSPANRPALLTLDYGLDAIGGRTIEEFAPVDQYRLQVEQVSEAITHGGPILTDIDDAILNMRVVDALFRSVESGRFETIFPASDNLANERTSL